MANLRTYEVTTPDGLTYEIDAPEGTPETQLINDVWLYHQERLSKQGVGSSIAHGLHTGVADVESGIATLLNKVGATDLGGRLAQTAEEDRAKADKNYAPLLEADVKAAEQRGFFPGLAAEAKQHVVYPLAEMAGRFGPTMAATGLGGVPGLATALGGEYLAGVGHLKDTFDATPENALLGGIPLSVLNTMGLPLGKVAAPVSKAMGKALGRTAPETAEQAVIKAGEEATEQEAARLAAEHGVYTPEMLAEREVAPFTAGSEAAAKAAAQYGEERSIPSWLGDVATGTVGNAAVTIPVALGNELIGRQVGENQTPLTAEEAAQIAKDIGYLAPVFGLAHGTFHNPKAAVSEAAQRGVRSIEERPEAYEAQRALNEIQVANEPTVRGAEPPAEPIVEPAAQQVEEPQVASQPEPASTTQQASEIPPAPQPEVSAAPTQMEIPGMELGPYSELQQPEPGVSVREKGKQPKQEDLFGAEGTGNKAILEGAKHAEAFSSPVVTEDTLSMLGMGKRAKKIIGKDISDPAQHAEVSAYMEAFNGGNYKHKLADKYLVEHRPEVREEVPVETKRSVVESEFKEPSDEELAAIEAEEVPVVEKQSGLEPYPDEALYENSLDRIKTSVQRGKDSATTAGLSGTTPIRHLVTGELLRDYADMRERLAYDPSKEIYVKHKEELKKAIVENARASGLPEGTIAELQKTINEIDATDNVNRAQQRVGELSEAFNQLARGKPLNLKEAKGKQFNEKTQQLADLGNLKGLVSHFANEHESADVRRLLNRVQRLGLKTKLQMDSSIDGAGQFDPQTNTIKLHPELGANDHTAVHEIIHAAVSHVLDKPEYKVTKDLATLFKTVKDKVGDVYGATNLHEFVSELVSNPEFQAKLKSIPAPEGNLFKRAVRAIAEFLGFKKGQSAYTRGVKLVEDALDISGDAPRTNTELLKHTSKAAADLSAYTKTVMREDAKKPSWKETLHTAVKKYIDSWTGVESKLADKNVPMVLKNGKLRADLVARAFGQRGNIIRRGLHVGIPVASKDGTAHIARKPIKLHDGRMMDASLGNMQKLADSLGLDGRQTVQDVAYILDSAAQLKRDPRKAPVHVLEDMPKFREMEKKAHDLMAQKPVIKDVLDMWRAVNDGLIDFAYDSGLLTNELKDVFKKEKDYFPRFLLREEVMERLGVTDDHTVTIGNTHTKVFRERVASDHDVNLWENMAKHYASVLNGGFANMTKQAVLDQFVDHDLAKRIAPTHNTKQQGNVAVMRNGKREFYHLDDPTDIPPMMMIHEDFGPIFKAMRKGATVFRFAALANPDYWARQIARDAPAAAMLHDLGWLTPADTMRELMSIRKGSNPVYDKLLNAGIIGHVDPSISVADMHTFMQDIGKFAKQKGKLEKAVDNAVSKVEQMHIMVDGATRAAVYKAALKKAASKGLKGVDAENYALMMARESINFSIQGSSARAHELRTLVPFMSASMNGLMLLYKAITGKHIPAAERAKAKKQFLGKAAMVGMMSAAYAMYMEGDEKYADVMSSRKYSNLLIPTGNSDHPFAAVALPQELAFIKYVPEMMVNYTMGSRDNKQVMTDLFKQAQAMLPGGMGYSGVPIPQVVKPVIETILNTSFYTGESIESTAEKRFLKEHRGEGKVPSLATALSQHGGAEIGLSPRNIDYLFNAYGSQIGQAVLWAADSLLDSAGVIEKTQTPEKDWVEAPVIGMKGTFGKRDTSQVKTDFYNHMAEYDKIRATYNDYSREGEIDKAQEIANDPVMAKKMALASTYDAVSKKLSLISHHIDAVRNNANLSDTEKEIQIRELKHRQILMAKNVEAAVANVFAE